jgi:hypothetical protein
MSDPELDPDPDHLVKGTDPQQNVTVPKHCFIVHIYILILSILLYLAVDSDPDTSPDPQKGERCTSGPPPSLLLLRAVDAVASGCCC